jgi:hypothetical protein
MTRTCLAHGRNHRRAPAQLACRLSTIRKEQLYGTVSLPCRYGHDLMT